MVGKSLAEQGCTREVRPKHYFVKEAVFPFIKFPGVDTVLGPEMKSTGEVMGVGESFGEAYAKAQEGAGTLLPAKGKAMLSVRDGGPGAPDPGRPRPARPSASRLYATRGTADLGARGRAALRHRQQGHGGPAAHRRHDQEPRGELHRQHHRGGPGDCRFRRDPPRRAPAQGELHHHHRRGRGHLSGAEATGHPERQSVTRSTLRTPLMSKVPLTARGAEKLREELERLKRIERPRVIEAIAEARAHGDLKENAEYHAAREQQSFIEGRIKDLDGKLSNAQIIDVTKLPATGRVVFGATVLVLEMEKDEERTFQIVGDDEADLKQGMISISSPIARALIGKSEGDVGVVERPGASGSWRSWRSSTFRRRRVSTSWSGFSHRRSAARPPAMVASRLKPHRRVSFAQ